MLYARKILIFWVLIFYAFLSSPANASVEAWIISLVKEGFVFEEASTKETRGALKVEGVYYLVFKDGEIWLKNGDSSQAIALGRRVLAPPVSHPEGGILVLSEDCHLFQIFPDGSVEELLQGFGYCAYPPQVKGEALVVANSEGYVAAMHVSGTVYWVTKVPNLSASPVWLGDKVLVPARDRLLVLAGGEIWWQGKASGWEIYGSPVVLGNQVWVLLRRGGLQENGLLARLRLGTGELFIEDVEMVPYPKSPLGGYINEVFFLSRDGLEIWGQERKSIPVPGLSAFEFLWPPVGTGNGIWFVSLQGKLWHYDGEGISVQEFEGPLYAPLQEGDDTLLLGVATERGSLWQTSAGASLLAQLPLEDHLALTLFKCGEYIGLWPAGGNYWLYQPETGELQERSHPLPGIEETDLKDFYLPFFGQPVCNGEPLFPDLRDPAPLSQGGFEGRVAHVLKGGISTYWATITQCDSEDVPCEEDTYKGILLGEDLLGRPTIFQEAGPFYAPLSLLDSGEEIVLAANRNRVLYAFSASKELKGRFVMGGAALSKPEEVVISGEPFLAVASLDGFVHYYSWTENKLYPGQRPTYSCDAGAPITGALYREHRALVGTVDGKIIFLDVLLGSCRKRAEIPLREVSLQDILQEEAPDLYWVLPLTFEKDPLTQHWLAWVALTTWYGEPYTLLVQLDLTDQKILQRAYEGESVLRGRPVTINDKMFFLISN